MQILKNLLLGILALLISCSTNGFQVLAISYIANLLAYLGVSYFWLINAKKNIWLFLLPNFLISISVLISSSAAFPTNAPAHFILASLGALLGLAAQKYRFYSFLSALFLTIGLFIATPYWVFYWSIENRESVDLSANFTLVDLKGKHYTQDDFLNKTIFLDFWSLSCGACIENFPNVDKLSQHYANNQNVGIYLVNLGKSDKFEKWQKFIQKHNFQHLPMLYDTLGILSKSLEINAVPLHLIVKNGKISWSHIGISTDEKKIFAEKLISIIDNIAAQ